MKKEQEIYRTILQTLPDIVYEIDKNGCFIYINDAVEKLGFKSKELIGNRIPFTYFLKSKHPAIYFMNSSD